MARAQRALEKLAEEAARIPAAEGDRLRADLLKQNLHGIRRGAREALVTEWTEAGPRQVVVPLDPAMGPRENMERYYRRYRRIVESAARVTARTAEVRARLGELETLFRAVDGARLDELPRLEQEARRLGAAPRPPAVPRSKRDEPLPPYRLFRSLTEVPLLVGRNAEANDVLTVTVARGNDLWLHARGLAGSHVVVRLEKGRPPDGETLLDAAHLAAHFSDGRGEPQVEVTATRAKYVRKAKGAPPGSVTYTQEKTIFVRVEVRRVERLLASEEGHPLKALSRRS
jgi:predicted ribosome quality control (RQC) complex YloA/Tae2 family protein